ncbi:xanthine dehydrogenase family protein molybdopterin-binding subunit [Sphingomonas oligophenolica]|uniref:Xanthine dehydrogenase family protein molybdopterin-binding subunit n=1 Tax=Sphingomonas oligophenolica TaxID=301154 RepID=A0A502C5I8_9SPHN|nr:xanthine dehydrogenase family protein molybdopterin-binding subunit [Sphingomonas oligophenolica]TPG08447.1 xanthine dehydrogenase family protein molybdopterin-binding subunit [Sphingomonas oligophenolica]
MPKLDILGALRSVGQPMRRKEDQRLITGQGQFTDDFTMPDQCWTAMVRSPYPHAAIRGIDDRGARALPGVIAVLTGSDALADGIGQIPHNPVPSTRFDVKLTGRGGTPIYIGEHFLLPVDRARYVGEAVAMVVAETREQALTAAEAVIVDWDPLPWVAGTREAAADTAPPVWDGLPDNILVDATFGDEAATDAAFAAAEHVVSATMAIGRVTGVPLEPRAALGWFDPETERYTLRAGSGGAVRQKHELATVLGVDPEQLRVISLDVGGNFGTRNRAYVEFGLVLWASRRVGRPVKFRADRSESFLTDYQGRDLVVTIALAINASGRFLAIRSDNLSNVGARCVSLSPLSKGSGLITGSYDIPVATLRSRATFSNTMPTQAYRSSGRPEVTFAIERLIDKAARELGFDRLELRRRNLVAPSQFPYRNAVGSPYDSGEYERNMDRLLEIADWTGAQERQRQARANGMLYGVGFANYVESSIGSPKERCDMIVAPDGTVEIVIGTQPAGQGHETSFAQVVADLLGIAFDDVTVTLGDTDVVTGGGGTHSGRSMRHASTVIALAAQDLVERAAALAAAHFEVTIDEVTFDTGVFGARDTNLSCDWAELARAAAHESAEGLRVRRDNEMHQPVFPNGSAMCEVEIDPETGGIEITRYTTVDDVGRCINPMIVHGQTHGGIAQGVGQALWEGCTIDPDSGQPLAGSLTDYGMPRSDNMPSFVTEIAEVISPTNPFGVKAGGEGGTTPAPAVIMSAIEDALAPLGAIEIEMPATPNRIWRAIQTLRDRQPQNAQMECAQ